jgi:hypothetical protein
MSGANASPTGRSHKELNIDQILKSERRRNVDESEVLDKGNLVGRDSVGNTVHDASCPNRGRAGKRRLSSTGGSAQWSGMAGDSNELHGMPRHR